MAALATRVDQIVAVVEAPVERDAGCRLGDRTIVEVADAEDPGHREEYTRRIGPWLGAVYSRKPMETWRRFRSLNGRDRRMVIEAAALLLLVRAGLPLLPFHTLRRSLGYYADASRPAAPGSTALVPRVAWAVTAAARRLPIRTTCLVESLAGDTMLRRRGVSCDLRFGVRPPQRGELAAHAWVEHEGRVIFGALDELSEYSVLSPTRPTPPTRPTRPS